MHSDNLIYTLINSDAKYLNVSENVWELTFIKVTFKRQYCIYKFLRNYKVMSAMR